MGIKPTFSASLAAPARPLSRCSLNSPVLGPEAQGTSGTLRTLSPSETFAARQQPWVALPTQPEKAIMRQLNQLTSWSTIASSSSIKITKLKPDRRYLSLSAVNSQARQKLHPVVKHPPPRRPNVAPDNPYLPVKSLVGAPRLPKFLPEESWRYPIAIPSSAVDAELTKKIDLSPASESDPTIALQVRQEGETLVSKIVEDWIRNELNVMNTITEETIQIFMKMLLNPSTLAPLASKMKLRTAGRRVPVKASRHAPKRVVPASTHADQELCQLLYYLVGSINRLLNPSSTTHAGGETVKPPERLKKYILNLIKHGLVHTSARELLIRASQLSGQAMIGNKTSHARAELRVAQLEIWGDRRSRKLRKLVPEQKAHRTPLRVRKATLLKQRWKDEELKMVHWRNRLLKVTAFEQNEIIAEKLRRAEHSNQVKQWKQENLSRRSEESSPNDSTFFSRLFNFWPFNNPVSTPSSSKAV